MAHQNNWISSKDIILNASQALRDDNYRKAGGEPFYLNQAYRAIRKMCFDSSHDVRHCEIDITGLIVDQPPQSSGIIDLFLINDNDCQLIPSRRVRIKNGMFNKGGSGFLSRNMWNNRDPLQWNSGWSQTPPRCLYFCGAENGKFYLSASCMNFTKLHVVYTGLGVTEYGEHFDVPEWAAEAVTDFVTLKAAERLQQDNLRYYTDVMNRKEREVNIDNPEGSWHQALVYWKRMDKKTRTDLIQYLTRPMAPR